MLKRGFHFAPGYRLQEFLGRGQFGQVWRASAPGGTATAVKFIDLSDGQGEREYEAIRRVKLIRHANLMPITAIWLLDGEGKVIEEAPDEAFETIDLSVAELRGQSAINLPDVEPSWLVVAMLLGGKSLQHRLRECLDEGLQGIPPKELIAYMDESAKGIDFLNSPQHDLGDGPIAIQHSDIKPANIVLIGSSAVVCDFGLARILNRNQVTATSAAGTPAYMAPESISSKPSRTSDQYSLAVTYYHLRTGALPLNDGSLWEVLDAHRQGNLRFGLLPQAEQQVLHKATDLNWENRFPTSVDFVDALRDALRSEGETRPSFLPLRPGGQALTGKGPTPAESEDLKDTVDLSGTADRGDPSMETSAPLVEHEESTDNEAVPHSTTAPLEKSPPEKLRGESRRGTSASSLIDRIKQHPLVTAGIALAGCAALYGTLVLSGGDGRAKQIPANELLAEALALVDSDAASAATLFQQALHKDPGLKPASTRVSGLNGPVMQCRTSPDGRWLVSMDDRAVPILRDISQDPMTTTALEGHQTLLNDFELDSSGQRLLTGGFDSTPRVWRLNAADVSSSPLLLKGQIEGEIEAVAWSPSKPIAAAISSDTKLGIWELGPASTESPAGSIKNSRVIDTGESLKSLVCDPGDTWLAATTLGANRLEPQPDVVAYRWNDLWNAQGSPAPIRLGLGQARRIAFLTRQSEPSLVVGEVGGSVAVVALTSQKLVERIEPEVFSQENHIEAIRVAALDDHDVVVAGDSDGSVVWWKFGQSSLNKRRQFSDDSIASVDVSPDGRWVAAGAADGSVWLWDTQSETEQGAIRLSTNTAAVDSVAIATQSNWLIAGCDDGTIQMWDLAHVKLMAIATPTKVKVFQVPVNEKQIDAPKVAMR